MEPPKPGYDYQQPAPWGQPTPGQFGAAPTPAEEPPMRADLGARFAAAMIDGVVMIGAMIPGIILVLMDPNTRAGSEDPGPLGLAGSLLLMVGGLAQAIVQWVLIARRGQSLGKIAMKIHIRKQDGSAVDFVSGVLLRSWAIAGIAAVINVVTCGTLGWVVNLADILFIFGDERRCLHDRIASTDVLIGHSPEALSPF